MDIHEHRQGVKYDNEQDRRNGYLEAQKRHAYKPWVCNLCSIKILKGNKANHLKSNKHRNNISQNAEHDQ